MDTKEFTNFEEADKFVNELLKDNKTVDAVVISETQYQVNWVDNKKYTTLDGREYTDEVWVKKDGTMIHCQDLEVEHARNIIRMILRSNRTQQEAMKELLENVYAAAGESNDSSELEVHTDDTPRVLH